MGKASTATTISNGSLKKKKEKSQALNEKPHSLSISATETAAITPLKKRRVRTGMLKNPYLAMLIRTRIAN